MLRKLSLLTKKTKRFFSDTFMKGENSLYIESLYNEWVINPKSVDISWHSYFENITRGLKSEESVIDPDTLLQSNFIPSVKERDLNRIYFQLALLIKDFRTYGHYVSQIDPLDYKLGKVNFEEITDFFTLERSGIDKEFYDAQVDWSFPFLKNKLTTIREIHSKLTELYCGKISFEYMHMNNVKEIEWIREKIEVDSEPLSKEEKLNLLERILESQIFTNFCERRFSTSKRFGIEGLDAAISGLGKMTLEAKNFGVKEIILGMAHRGRLNTLGCVFRKPYSEIFGEFEQASGRQNPKDKIFGYTGDVKYHCGTHHQLEFSDGYNMNITLLSNPSHLEVVNPVVLGNVKARQYLTNRNGEEVLPILIHGDAAFSGQGINYELQQLEKLKDFEVGGCIHIVFNNQIGFTTNPDKGRSSYHCTSIARLNKSFVIHVNGDEPELVDRALTLAMDYRTKFKKDVFVDIVGYRKFGHNEQDYPDFTQPIMYNKIRKIQPMYEKYIEKLVKEGVLTQEEIDKKIDDYMDFFKQEHAKGKNGDYDMQSGDFYKEEEYIKNQNNVTGISNCKELGTKIHSLPSDFTFHPNIIELYKKRLDIFENNKHVDFSSAESLAFASLLQEGHKIRLSGEDCKKGMFNLRHSHLMDQNNQNIYVPIKSVLPEDRENDFKVVNSPLTELAICGYEYGYSLGALKHLTIWQVSLGEYLNEAQMILDQFINTSEKKWGRFSGLVIMIPHTLDENNSINMNTHLERILTNVSDDYFFYEKNEHMWEHVDRNENIRVCNPSTSANFFHLLRSQVKNDYRKPLYLLCPRKIYSIEAAFSPQEHFDESHKFLNVIDDDSIKKQNVKKLVFCSGQFYYDLVNNRRQYKREDDVAIVRLEKLGPFPYSEVNTLLQNYPENCEVVFAQEEVMNFGAFSYVEPRLNILLKKNGFREVKYIGKKVSSVTGYSFSSINKKVYNSIFEKLFK
jgi:2-oxoglutarate dehydrogenase E1 component